jgi:hypothetical protein
VPGPQVAAGCEAKIPSRPDHPDAFATRRLVDLGGTIAVVDDDYLRHAVLAGERIEATSESVAGLVRDDDDRCPHA